MRRAFAISAVLFLGVLTAPAGVCGQGARGAQAASPWTIHDPYRPVPAVIDPGTASTQQLPGRPPSDAKVLFDGRGLSEWQMEDGAPAKWKVVDGTMEVVPGSGYLWTKEAFGDCQLHIEWTAPTPNGETGQDRGNSGVFLMGLFEVQVLDSYQNTTYADGQAAALYGQYPPLVNAMRAPGQWQTYDIIFHRPRFDSAGRLTRTAHVTVLHNGVLVQDDVELTGPTGNHERPPYQEMPDKLPLALQDHGDLVRFRNIWVRELPEAQPALPPTYFIPVSVDAAILARYVGHYAGKDPDLVFDVTLDGTHLMIQQNGSTKAELLPQSEETFLVRTHIGEVIFPKREQGGEQQLVFRAYGSDSLATRAPR